MTRRQFFRTSLSMLLVRSSFVLATCVVLYSMPSMAHAQIRASELGTVSQIIDGTKITITYSRPRMRGRAEIFGTRAAHWGEVWTPGANYATTLEASKNITINDNVVPKGKYSVWMVLKEKGDWTTVLDPNWNLYHMNPPDSLPTQIRFPVHVEQAPSFDVLTWSFPEITASGATLAMHWTTSRAVMKVGVTPSLTVTMKADDAKPYLGQYTFKSDEFGAALKNGIMNITYENGTLKAQMVPNDPYMSKFALIRVAPDVFAPGLYDKTGAIYEVLRPDMIFTFKRVNGVVASYEARDDTDSVMASGSRK